MTSAEVMTVCDNVCRDFGWLTRWLQELASNPVWALFIGGVISFVIWRMQTKLSAELELKREKRELYRSFISQIGKAVRVKHEVGASDWHLSIEVRKLWALQKEIHLVGSKGTQESSLKVLDAVKTHFTADICSVTSIDGKVRSLDDNTYFVTDRMVDLMKIELGTVSH